MTVNISRKVFLKDLGRIAGVLGSVACSGCSSGVRSSGVSSGDVSARGSDRPVGSISSSGSDISHQRDDIISAGSSYRNVADFRPYATTSPFCMGVNMQLAEGLYGIDFRDFTVYNQLAADEPAEVDQKTFTIRLRDGLKFSDGSDVSSKDVVESFERAVHSDTLYAAILAPFESLEATDDSTVTLHLNYPFMLIQQRLAMVGIVAAHQSDDMARVQPICTGPWKMDGSSEDSQTVTLVPNEFYSGTYPAQDSKLIYSSMTDDATRYAALRDATTVVMENVPAQIVEQVEEAGFSLDAPQGFSPLYILFDTAIEPWSDYRVRQAIFYAINVDQIITDILCGQASAATSFLPESFNYYHRAAMIYTYDPNKARDLLSAAGVTPGEIVVHTLDYAWIAPIAAQVKTDLDALGFSTTINAHRRIDLNACASKEGWRDFVLAADDPSRFGNDPDLLIGWWYGSDTWVLQRSFWQTSDPTTYAAFSDLMEQARQSIDVDAQRDLWNNCYDLIAEQVPMYPLLHRKVITAYDANRISGFSGIAVPGMNFCGAKMSGK